MNIRDIDPEYVKQHGGHYNKTSPRVAQGDTRARKGFYQPRFQRAPHDIPTGQKLR